MYNNIPPFFTPKSYVRPKNIYYNNNLAEKKYNSEEKLKEPPKTSSKKEEESSEILFEIFGLKIYFDDVLILCILLFLYQEEIHDEYLFIALILLLLS